MIRCMIRTKIHRAAVADSFRHCEAVPEGVVQQPSFLRLFIQTEQLIFYIFVIIAEIFKKP